MFFVKKNLLRKSIYRRSFLRFSSLGILDVNFVVTVFDPNSQPYLYVWSGFPNDLGFVLSFYALLSFLSEDSYLMELIGLSCIDSVAI